MDFCSIIASMTGRRPTVVPERSCEWCEAVRSLPTAAEFEAVALLDLCAEVGAA